MSVIWEITADCEVVSVRQLQHYFGSFLTHFHPFPPISTHFLGPDAAVQHNQLGACAY